MLVSKMHLTNTIWGLIVIYPTFTLPYVAWILIPHIAAVPKELEDAAKIDGCSFFSTWWRVILPLSKPILATVALMTLRASWNNYLLPTLMLARDQAATTLVVAVAKLQSSGGAGASQYNLMMAGTMLAMLPMRILFLCMNKMFVEGITKGAVTG